MAEVAFGPFLDCQGGPWSAVAAVLIDGTGYQYALKREHGTRWSVHRWRARENPRNAVVVHEGAFARIYAEDIAREDARSLSETAGAA